MKNLNFHSQNLDDILFENRNKKYGAYELRKSHDSRLIKSFLSALLLIGTVACIPVLIDALKKKNPPVLQTYTTTMVDLNKDIAIEQKTQLAALPPTKPDRSKADLPYLVKKDSLITKNDTKKDTLLKSSDGAIAVNSSHDSLQGTSNDTSASNGNPVVIGTDLIASAKPYPLFAVDKVPEFHGGESALLRFLEKNINYLEKARMAGIKGKIFASFIISSTGEVQAVKILYGLGYGLDEEVVRVLNNMPVWEPGYYKGKPVSTILNIPVSFNLLQ